MTYSTYGYGLDNNTLGSVTAYGLGINFLGTVKNESILFGLDLDLNLISNISRNTNILFTHNLSIDAVTQLDRNPNIIFQADLDFNSLKELISDREIIFNLGLSFDIVSFLIESVFIPGEIFIVAEEIRLCSIKREIRSITLDESRRYLIVTFEDRTYELIDI